MYLYIGALHPNYFSKYVVKSFVNTKIFCIFIIRLCPKLFFKILCIKFCGYKNFLYLYFGDLFFEVIFVTKYFSQIIL